MSSPTGKLSGKFAHVRKLAPVVVVIELGRRRANSTRRPAHLSSGGGGGEGQFGRRSSLSKAKGRARAILAPNL